MKSLVLAEKPSVGKDLGRVLNCRPHGRGFMEGDKYVVTWALGHLVTLAEPETYDAKFKQWNLEYLPMLPEKMKLKVMKQTSQQFSTVKSLLQRKDIFEVIIATDAGREGELVARWIIMLGGWKNKPMKRLWISSQTDSAIKDGFANLKPSQNYDNLFQAAVGRAEADWLVGLNVTRALTCKFDARLNAGRVQTPTLALIVNREEDIRKFVPVKFWKLNALCPGFIASWQDQKGNDRIFDKSKAESLLARLKGKNAIVISVTKKAKSESAPLAYDLTELQRDANRRYGMSAKDTLHHTQMLYERFKLVTYPRTDSRYITKDMVPTLKQRLQQVAKAGYSRQVEPLLRNEINPSNRFVNDAKVSDHHAIIPTEIPVHLSSLSSDEKKIYDLIVKRFITVLYPPYKYEQIIVLLEIEKETFRVTGRIVQELGWRAVSSIMKDDDEEEDSSRSIPELKKGQVVKVNDLKLVASQTKPPSRYTEATLLTAMENPGKFIEDEELRDSIKSGGLGTPATRADIIEKLINGYYVERNGKELVPTAKAFELIRLVPETLKHPELTAEWEKRLGKIAKGEENKNRFIADIRQNTADLVSKIKASEFKFEITNLSNEKCPVCGAPMMKFTDKFVCSDRKCGNETGMQKETGMRTERKSKKDHQMDKQLLQRFGKQEKKQEETLGDLFDF
ncbi:MAG: DNA topoisomerase III [Candidatus Cloacimonadales bacterium]|nr:DNA topoisomerase III [Candidatus Cloacimonadales bacterium]